MSAGKQERITGSQVNLLFDEIQLVLQRSMKSVEGVRNSLQQNPEKNVLALQMLVISPVLDRFKECMDKYRIEP